MDYGVPFHDSHSREVMQNFKRYEGNVKLTDNKSLDITCVGYVVLKNSLGYEVDFKECQIHSGIEKNMNISEAT